MKVESKQWDWKSNGDITVDGINVARSVKYASQISETMNAMDSLGPNNVRALVDLLIAAEIEVSDMDPEGLCDDSYGHGRDMAYLYWKEKARACFDRGDG